jgi:hypothetical protein
LLVQRVRPGAVGFMSEHALGELRPTRDDLSERRLGRGAIRPVILVQNLRNRSQLVERNTSPLPIMAVIELIVPPQSGHPELSVSVFHVLLRWLRPSRRSFIAVPCWPPNVGAMKTSEAESHVVCLLRLPDPEPTGRVFVALSIDISLHSGPAKSVQVAAADGNIRSHRTITRIITAMNIRIGANHVAPDLCQAPICTGYSRHWACKSGCDVEATRLIAHSV